MKKLLLIIVMCLMPFPAHALEYVYSDNVPVTVQLQGGTLKPVDIGMVDVEMDGETVQQYRFHYLKFQDTAPTPGQIDQYQAADVDVQKYSKKHPNWLEKLPKSEIKDAVAPLIQGRVLKADLTDEEYAQIISGYTAWTVGLSVETGIVYRYDNQLYRTIQPHTTQSDWTPDIVPALFALATPPSVIADWVQPTGAHDAYQIGDRVQYDGQIWESKIDANTTVPDGDVPYNRYWDVVE